MDVKDIESIRKWLWRCNQSREREQRNDSLLTDNLPARDMRCYAPFTRKLVKAVTYCSFAVIWVLQWETRTSIRDFSLMSA